jgi:uridine phosphorylase
MGQRELPITGLPVGGVSPSVIVCGDPARADRIAALLDGPQRLSDRREYRAHNGRYGDLPVTVCSHGVGAPGAAVAFEELIAAGARRIVRVGTCGGMQPGLEAGHVVIASAAVQNTGFGREYAPPGYPAAADPALTLALGAAAAAAGHQARTGIVLSRDVFYGGAETADTPSYAVLSRANVLAVEMECAALFLVGGLRGVPAASILAVDGNVLAAAESMESYQPGREVVHRAVDAAIRIALEALRASA